MSTKENIKNNPFHEEDVEIGNEHFLVLYNDDYHTFDYVIDTLIDVCEHEPEQAVQCTLLVHYKGKCDVKKGSFNYLSPMKKALVDRDLKATIN